jgi:hypothetical protein
MKSKRIQILSITGVLCMLFVFSLQADVIDRPWEAVVVPCCYLPELVVSSVSVDYVRLVAFKEGEWTVIPFQVDEGTWDTDPDFNVEFFYYDRDDDPGVIDNSDEICFMVQDCGDRVPHDEWMSGAGTIRYEVGVYDGVDNANRGWAYIVLAPGLTPDPTDYIDIVEPNTFDTDAYTIVFNHNASGDDHIMTDLYIKPPFGDGVTDFYDCSKSRIHYRLVFPPIDLWSSENDLDILDSSRYHKDGVVRCIAQFDGESAGIAKTLHSSSSYYQKYIDTDNTVSTQSALIKKFHSVRYSRDLNENVDGFTVYTDFGYECQEFTVDGVMDDMMNQPVGEWIQIDHPTAGSNVMVQELSEVEALVDSVRLFYFEGDQDPSPVNTCSNGLWGEHGFIAYNPEKTKLTINTKTFMTEAGLGCVGPAFEEYYLNPVQYSGAYQIKDPTVTVSAAPGSDHIVIPKKGGNVSFYASVKNNTSQKQNFVAWVDVTIPTGKLPKDACVYNAVFGPMDIMLPPQYEAGKNLVIAVPPYAPAGMYTMNCKIGNTTEDIVWSDSFPFRKEK